MYIDPAYQKLLDCGIRPSLQRIEIMRYLQTHHTHPTIDEIFNELKKHIPTVSRTTIYNTLRMFSERGGALMITIDEHHVCYDGNTTPHAHFCCKECGHVFDMPDMQPPVPQSMVVNGFRVDDAQLYYKGICAHCLEKKAEKVS
ncbi:transcriptional repressor [Prevotella aurantiaca JCM 15754]|jgi:transcriptional regulator, fur family|uniref:Transcriptional repressor n=1 Tax=Prevotella aurantiaca TaxID=596085 RepID=A0A930HKB5_9BACT|nr:transcriptional repressor [Prevotella aurantiaca]MBF1383374.1 transcriptional repressor [Prevotella aurantiaca]MBF1386824.1 transcriptional repressor [Prevotella aurantiaca]